MPRPLNYMRDTDGRTPMSNDFWDAVLAQSADLNPRLAKAAAHADFEIAHEWKGVSRMFHFRAQRDAARARRSLFYAQGLKWSASP